MTRDTRPKVLAIRHVDRLRELTAPHALDPQWEVEAEFVRAIRAERARCRRVVREAIVSMGEACIGNAKAAATRGSGHNEVYYRAQADGTGLALDAALAALAALNRRPGT